MAKDSQREKELEKKLLEQYTTEELKEMKDIASQWPDAIIVNLGASGQIGSYEKEMLEYMFGPENVYSFDLFEDEEKGIISADALKPADDPESVFYKINELNKEGRDIIVFNNIAALSKLAEDKPELGKKLNSKIPVEHLDNLINGLFSGISNVVRIVQNSSIGAYRTGEDLIKTGDQPVVGKDNNYGEQKDNLQGRTKQTNILIKGLKNIKSKFNDSAEKLFEKLDKLVAISTIVPGFINKKIDPAAGTTEEIDRFISVVGATLVTGKYGLQIDQVLKSGLGEERYEEFKKKYLKQDGEGIKYAPKIPLDAEVVMISAESFTLNIIRHAFAEQSKIIDDAHNYVFGDFTASISALIELFEDNEISTDYISKKGINIDKFMKKNMELWPKGADTSKAAKDFGYKIREIFETAALKSLASVMRDYEDKLLEKGTLTESEIIPSSHISAKILEFQALSQEKIEKLNRQNLEIAA